MQRGEGRLDGMVPCLGSLDPLPVEVHVPGPYPVVVQMGLLEAGRSASSVAANLGVAGQSSQVVVPYFAYVREVPWV
jgi:hypothetical protein